MKTFKRERRILSTMQSLYKSDSIKVQK